LRLKNEELRCSVAERSASQASRTRRSKPLSGESPRLVGSDRS
jgi:hypothetical protein